MKDHPARAAAHPLSLLAVLLFATPLMAQQRPPGEVDPARARFEDTNRREMELRGMGGASKKTDPKEIEAIVARIKQDFESILSVHNEIVRSMSDGKTPDPDFVSSATATIRKRAGRLQTTLGLDKLEPSDQNQHNLKNLNGSRMKDALVVLCRQIESFTSNPVIKTPGLVDAQQLASARHDLQGVIELADGISKGAEKLKKNTK